MPTAKANPVTNITDKQFENLKDYILSFENCEFKSEDLAEGLKKARIFVGTPKARRDAALKKLLEFKPAEGRIVVVVGYTGFMSGDWGRGTDPKRAFEVARKPKFFEALDCIAGSYVRGDGGVGVDGEDNPNNLPQNECFKPICEFVG